MGVGGHQSMVQIQTCQVPRRVGLRHCFSIQGEVAITLTAGKEGDIITVIIHYIFCLLKCGPLDLDARSFLSDWLFLTKTGDKATGWQGIFYLFCIVINYYGLVYLKHPMPCAQYIFVEWMNKLCILYYTGVFHTRAYVLRSQKPCAVQCKKMAANQDVYPIWNKILLFLPRKGGICFFSHLGLGWPLINEVQ